MRISQFGKPFGFKKGNNIWLGRKHTRTTKEKMRINQIGSNNTFYGHHHSKEYILMMIGNSYCRDYLSKNPVWKKPDWDNRFTGFDVPSYVSLLPGRIKPIEATRYYCQGVIPQGLPISAL